MSVQDQLTHRRGAEDAEDAEFAQRELTDLILAAAIEVHSVLGPGMLESIYQGALRQEPTLRAVPFVAEVAIPIVYKGTGLETALRLDLIVDRRVIVEVKALSAIEEVHRAQVLSFLRVTNLTVGLRINFNVPLLKTGVRRIVNSQRSSAPSAPLR